LDSRKQAGFSGMNNLKLPSVPIVRQAAPLDGRVAAGYADR